MSDFEKIARKACKGKRDLPEKELSQPNWIRFMMGLDLIEDSVSVSLSEEQIDYESDLLEVLEDIEKPIPEKTENITQIDKTIIEDFLKLWLENNQDKHVMPTICRTLKNYGELQNYKNKDFFTFDFFENFILNYCLMQCNLKVLLAYKQNTDSSWLSYFLKYISTIIKEEFVPVVRKPRSINKSTFTFRAIPNKTIALLSKKADVSCIKDTSLQLTVGRKVVAHLTPKPGLKFKCDKKLFKSEEPLISMVIKNFKNRSERTSYAESFHRAQFLSSELFKDCKQLINVELSDKVKVIESGCFDGCSGMKKLEMPYDYLIEDESGYPFKIICRKPPVIIEPFDFNERQIASNDSFENFGNNDMIPAEEDDDTSSDDIFDDGGKTWENGTEDKYDNQGVSVNDIDEAIERVSQSVGELNDSNDIRLCLTLMPNKLHFDILYYTYYGLPFNGYRRDRNGNVPIGEIAKYLTGKCGKHNWSAEKYRATIELHNLYISYTTLADWKMSKSDKINEVKTFLLKDERICKDDKLKWFVQLLSGLSFAKIARKAKEEEMKMLNREELNKEELGKEELEKKEKSIRRGVGQVFYVIYEFINK